MAHLKAGVGLFGGQLGLAQRKRQLVSDELTQAALQLLALKGFDAVTIDEIATAAGVSKRTFFRYFASKEDVVVQFLAGMGPTSAPSWRAGPPRSARPRHCSTPSRCPSQPVPTSPTGRCP